MGDTVKGWTLTKGNAGDRAPDNITIYSSSSKLRIIKTGEDVEKKVADATGLNTEEAAEVIKEYDEEQEQRNDAYKNYQEEHKKYVDDVFAAQKATDAARRDYNAYVKKYNKGSEIDQEKMEDELDAKWRTYSDAVDKQKAAAAAMAKHTQEFSDKWGGPSTTLTKAVKEDPPIVKSQAQMDAEIADLQNTINNMKVDMAPASDLASWFDAMEAYIDSMPQLKEDNTQLYEVEKQGNWWVYTGEVSTPDPAYNQKIREFKQSQCKKLNALIESATAKIEDILNDIAKKCAPIMPMITAIQIIRGGLSLSTIVKWGNAAIDMFNSVYKMFYGAYKNVMSMMELVVVRFPQLISKMMDKVTELDCPVNFRSIHVSMPQNATQGNNKDNKAIIQKLKKSSGGTMV